LPTRRSVIRDENVLEHRLNRPVILTTDAEIEQWMTGPAEEALKLQRPLPDGALKIVASGEKKDEAA
jgi:putative SOS response-associated peptidase YedK